MADDASSIKAAIALVRDIRAGAGSLASPPQARIGAGAGTQNADLRTAEEPQVPAPTAFISWAHAHSSWTPAQVADWEEQVATFAARLIKFGVNAEVDLWHLDEPTDWTRFGPRELQRADRAVIIMSEAWAERWSGANGPREGAGAAAEADTLRGLFSRNQAEWQQKLLIVMFPGVPDSVIPPDLVRISRVYLDPTLPDDYETLLRNLSRQPRYVKPELGKVPRFSQDDFQYRLARVQTKNYDQLQATLTGTREDESLRSLRVSILRGLNDATEDDES